jgi:hypothetical protein
MYLSSNEKWRGDYELWIHVDFGDSSHRQLWGSVFVWNLEEKHEISHDCPSHAEIWLGTLQKRSMRVYSWLRLLCGKSGLAVWGEVSDVHSMYGLWHW